MVFLIILKLRDGSSEGGSLDTNDRIMGDEAVRKLVEIRAYLEKGVRPLEGRLKYQIGKVLRAADDAELSNVRRKASQGRKRNITNGSKATTDGSDVSGSDSDSSGSGDSTSSHEAHPKIDDLSYRPNPAGLSSNSTKGSSSNARSNAAYKPPRITPRSMPDLPSSTNTNFTHRTSLRDRKSHLLDEYVSTELSSAPNPEPSIGSNSTILKRGRGILSARERDKERERTEYEERNFSRLPRESKAERRKGKVRGEGRRMEFGGEDWSGLGDVGDRVVRSVGKGPGNRSGKEGKGGVLERREKRRRERGDVGTDDGRVGIGESFEKRRKVLERRAERKRKS